MTKHMNVYDVKTCYNFGQIHSVVAESLAEAERVYLKEYRNTTIDSIEIHAAYVLIQGKDEQAKEVCEVTNE